MIFKEWFEMFYNAYCVDVIAYKVCDYDNCCCYAHCEECIFYLTDSPACENCSVPCYDD